MWPLVRHARYLGRYREIAWVLGHHGFGYLIEQLGLISLLSLPRRMVLRAPPPTPVGVGVRLREALCALGPTFVKLGQLVSTRPDLLPPDIVAELDKLQDTVPPFPGEVAIATIEAELGQPINRLFREFCPEPFAAASLGQVHAAVLFNGDQVVVKVQRPDIAGRVDADLAIVAELAALAQERTEFGSQYNLVDLAWEFSTTLRAELDYRLEGRNAERFRRNFAGSQLVYIPRIYWELTSARVLTSEHLHGVKINDIAGLTAAGLDRARIARNSMELILQEIFTDGFFHSDPHPGNFFALPGEVIGAVDFGQVGVLDRETTRNLVMLLSGLVNRDTGIALHALEQMGTIHRRHITPALRRDMQRLTDRFVDRPLAELSARETLDQLMGFIHRHHLTLPGPLAVLFKALVMMEGTGLQIDPTLDVFRIARPYVEQIATEQISPGAFGERVIEQGRAVSTAAIELPQQVNDLLRNLNEGNLVVQTRDQDLRRIAAALIGFANRLAVALVLTALIIALGLLAVAVGIGQWRGWMPITLAVLLLLGIVVNGLILGLALLRGRDV